MTKELRRLSILVLAMFLLLFGSTTWIQVLSADELASDPHNRRTLYDSFQVQRGSIVVDGSAIASSVAANDVYTWQRVYADPAMWAPVTGFYNPALGSATGIEQAMNKELSGTDNTQFLSRIDEIVTGQPRQGANVVLTLDARVQKAAYDALGSLQGAVVAIEPKTGRILAMVSSPSYDTNTLAGHDPSTVEANYDALVANANHPLYNRAIAGDMNPPGSTFKLVVASAALASGKYTPQSTLPNPSAYQLPQTNNYVHNSWGGTCGGGDVVTIADAIRLSCNIPMAELAVQLGDDAIRDEAEKYGFNRSFSMPLDSEASVYPRGLDAPQTGLSGFGQGQVRATPLQMAMVSAGIANGGMVMNPRMVDQVIGPDLSVQKTFDNTELGRSLDQALAAQVNQMMVSSVRDGAASNATIDGVQVAGKTGTAENGSNDPYTLWFTGFAPADDPKVAVAVVVENGGGQGQSGSGNDIAAPIAKKVMEAVLGK